MSEKKTTAALAPTRGVRDDALSLLRQFTSQLDQAFDDPFSFGWRWPALRGFEMPELPAWTPKIDVFERDNRLVTKVDLPGLKKEDVKVEVTDGQLSISGERKSETEEKKDNVYRSERSYGSFCRMVPLPEGAKIDDVKATFANGVLEVSVPMPAAPAAAVRKVEVQDAAPAAKSAA